MTPVTLILLLSTLVGLASSQQLDDCPRNWFTYRQTCYYFQFDPKMTVQEAELECQRNHSSLLSINSVMEHNYISGWLTQQDGERNEWLTSGFRETSGNLIWRGDNTQISAAMNYFAENSSFSARPLDPDNDLPMNRIVYRYDNARQDYLWAWQRIMVARPFVCEVSQRDVWKVYQMERDFSFGTGQSDPNKIEKGPKIITQMVDTVFFAVGDRMTPVILDCQATGNPQPTYKWFRKNTGTRQWEEVTGASGARFTLTNGRLTLDQPVQTLDSTSFYCEATNKFGSVWSDNVKLTYGAIEEFNNVPPSPVVAQKYKGTMMVCSPPAFSPAVTYNWFKGNVASFIRPELNAQYFLSRAGAFFISETHDSDIGRYFCSVFLSPGIGQQLASFQTASALSTPMQLSVIGSNPSAYGPEIHNLFPAIFPDIPMIGNTVIIECFAYGRLPLNYRWYRLDGPLSPDARITDHGRVLTIPNAQLSDTGLYSCAVKGIGRETKNTTLIMNAMPHFPYGLSDMHVDADSQVDWTCDAIAVPKATFKWYKDGVELNTDAALGITVSSNVLRFTRVQDSHQGMYQCEASNDHGVRRASGQLRTVAFAPTFEGLPVLSSTQAAVGGNISIACRPQAAPRATIRWTRNGQDVGTVAPNGDLELSFMNPSDSGRYTCTAENTLGSSESSCDLTVVQGTVFTNPPRDDDIVVGGSLQMPCEASFDSSKSDIIYTWKFNDHIIDFSPSSDDRSHWSMPYHDGIGLTGMLFIKGAKFIHEGYYTCMVRTVTGSTSSRAYITVRGPPGQPMGVHAADNNTAQVRDQVELWWQPGAYRGFPINKYTIQARSEFNGTDEWDNIAADLPETETYMDSRPAWRSYRITTGLSPGTAYNFRVLAGTAEVGYGPPSIPSPMVKMYDAAPVFAPQAIRGSKDQTPVGQLEINWNPLPRSYWGGPGLKYNVYYRRYFENGNQQDSQQWQQSGRISLTQFFELLTPELFYTPYQVKVQALNDIGYGPNSSIEIVYSAEDMPTAQPTEIAADAINSTAGIVSWDLQPKSRNYVRGTIYAFQINYWFEDNTRCPGTFEHTAQFVRVYGDVTEGLVVGMMPGADYCVNLQFINRAGLGSKTDNYFFPMWDATQGDYPEYVQVVSNGDESVRVNFRGVSAKYSKKWGHIEDPLRGYKAWWWDVREDIRSANEADFGKLETGTIHGVEKNLIYKLRVLSYNGGGYGKKSIDTYFTLGGQVVYDPTTTSFRNSSPKLHTSQALIVMIMLLFCCHGNNWIRMLLYRDLSTE